MYERYINIYCWISNTYYVTFKEQTTSLTNKPERMIKYYQWVPLILLCLAFGFLLPRFIYRFLTKQSGVDMLNMADAAVNYTTIEKFDQKRKILVYLTNTIHCYSSCNRTKRGFATDGSNYGSSNSFNFLNPFSLKSKLHGTYLTIIYLFTKLSYIGNCMVQLFVMNLFLGFKYNSQGLQFVKDVTNKLFEQNTNPYPQQKQQLIDSPSMLFEKTDLGETRQFAESVFPLGFDGKIASAYSYQSNSAADAISPSLLHRYFPRQSACDFRIRMNVDSMVQNFTVQCVLPINLFNEQLFTLIWSWLWIVFIINCYDLITWIVRVLPSKRYNYIRHRLHLKCSESSVKRSLDSFVNDYLSFDGVFLLRILTLNSSDIVTHEVVQLLWHNYTECNRHAKQSGNGQTSAQNRYTNINNRGEESNDVEAIKYVDVQNL
jgi:hypothetical protein